MFTDQTLAVSVIITILEEFRLDCSQYCYILWGELLSFLLNVLQQLLAFRCAVSDMHQTLVLLLPETLSFFPMLLPGKWWLSAYSTFNLNIICSSLVVIASLVSWRNTQMLSVWTSRYYQYLPPAGLLDMMLPYIGIRPARCVSNTDDCVLRQKCMPSCPLILSLYRAFTILIAMWQPSSCMFPMSLMRTPMLRSTLIFCWWGSSPPRLSTLGTIHCVYAFISCSMRDATYLRQFQLSSLAHAMNAPA